MGNCGLHVGTNCLDTSGSTLDVVPRNMELCIDTSGNRQLCAEIRMPVLSPVNACGLVLNDTASGKSIYLSITRLERDPNRTRDSDPNQVGDKWVVLTHTLVNTSPLQSGEPLAELQWVKVNAGEVVGELCKDSEALNLCKVISLPPPVASHLAFQLGTLRSNGSLEPVRSDVLAFLAIPRCLYDDWMALPGSPTRQPTPDRFHACP
jgi:hypothetical protein